VSINLLGIWRTHVEFEPLERLVSEHLLAMVPEAKALVNRSQLRPPTHTVQAEIPTASRTRQVDRVTEEQVSQPLALPRWNKRELVEIEGSSCRDLGPEVGVLRLKPKHANRLHAKEPQVI
jgi:hypothetical protein